MAVVEILPGDLATVECPAGSVPPLKAGDAIPKDKPLFNVVHVEGNKITLGPLKGGMLELDIPCGGEASIHFQAKTVQIKKEDLPQRAPPLAPERLAYPAWVWWTLLGAVMMLVALGAWYRSWYRKKQSVKARKRPPLPAKNPAEKFDHFLNTATKERWAENDSSRKLYTEAYELVRAYVEHRLAFHAPEATTREFMGELKAAILKWNNYVPPPRDPKAPETAQPSHRKVDPAIAGVIETLMLQADQVRFAGETPPVEQREAFVRNCAQVKSGV